MRNKIEIAAVTDSDLRAVLNRFGVAEKIDREEEICSSCSDVLTWESIGAFVVLGDRVKLFCCLSECLEAAEREKKHE